MAERSGELKGIRRVLGWNQEEMARLLGISCRALQSYEQGWRPLPIRVQQALALLLYLHHRRHNRKPAPCWRVRKCPLAQRRRCAVYHLRAGDVCWMIAGGRCETAKSMTTCRACPVMLVWWPDALAQPAVQVGGVR